MKAENRSVYKRIFVAFSDFAIVIALKNQIMTGYAISKYFMKKIGDTVSPSTVYATLATIERRGLIKCVMNKRGRAYSLTDEGRKIADNIENTVEESKRFIDKLLM